MTHVQNTCTEQIEKQAKLLSLYPLELLLHCTYPISISTFSNLQSIAAGTTWHAQYVAVQYKIDTLLYMNLRMFDS